MSRNFAYRNRKSPRQPEPWMEQLAWLMDRAIPLPGGWSIGLDGIFGLIPGLGDVVSSVISSFIIISASRNGLPRAAILRMLLNVGIDSLLGAVPLIGDVFDFAFKANTKNLEIYRQHLTGERTAARDWVSLAMTIFVLAIIAAVPIAAMILLLEWLFQSAPRGRWF